jgi:hypothetical protein
MNYLDKNPLSNSDNIRRNCVGNYTLSQKTFRESFTELLNKKAIRRISQSETRFVYDLTDEGRVIFPSIITDNTLGEAPKGM